MSEKSYPYSLTLTASERKAIDFVGDRYEHGHDLYKILCQTTWEPDTEECSWDSDEDITFLFEEWLAWEYVTLLRDSQYDLFAAELVYKLLAFYNEIMQ